ncbi:MAG: lysoplasmalogenase [Saprospiraceae bacterium]|nr:lysoplasmalogenase [Saprospiraceae bacterium]
MKFRGFAIIYFILAGADLWAMHTYPGLRMITKPLIISSLLIYYIMEAGNYQRPAILMALIFALTGDVFLLFDSVLFFQIGLASFLLMQLIYAFYFKRRVTGLVGPRLFLSVAVVLIAIIFNVLFRDEFGNLAIPVMLYTAAITFMVVMAIHQKISNLILYGALLFMLSDLCLAYQKFISQQASLDQLVMISYVLAQYLIIEGVLAEVPPSKAT